ncbi:sacsin N-terminal ATP-binding-like domain-containing protein [Microbacterium xanthum]|uniref:sacsin N-terminal ATP-binding-like domain-containing protein n=1 Tax=Microbacterium xanthum TaxID=3079794 RepID=UPI002AD5229F|nr:DUF3883 domain-containing protein [Microbacterium sp. KSW-48]MDZ8172421.1 DUF3883 domain-containing protein [Microbacterium sp. KSW-48]
MIGQSIAAEEALDAICRENLDVYEASAGRLREDVSQEAQVAHDYRGRLIYELLQNADDAFVSNPSSSDRALFRLTNDALWVANTGQPFSDADVRGLCGLGSSSKSASDGPKRASIGHKGLGFKSVLEITDTPEAYSRSVSFELGRQHARPLVEELWVRLGRGRVADVPSMRFPSGSFTYHPEWADLRDVEGYNSAFRFPFKNNAARTQRLRLGEQLLDFPMSSVLFLKHLEEVIIEVDLDGLHGRREWLIERSRVTEEGDIVRCAGLTSPGLYRVDLVDKDGDGNSYWIAHNPDVPIGSLREGLSGPAWDGVDLSEVSVAVRDCADPRIATGDRRFHVFLPTQEPADCSLLVNGAFVTDLSRKHVQVTASEADYNAHLVRNAASLFAEVLLPHMLRARDAAFVLRALEPAGGALGEAAELLQSELTRVLADAPLLPGQVGVQTLRSTVLPSPVLGERGGEFADLIAPRTAHMGRELPDRAYCEGELAAVSARYGALALSPAESLILLASATDPERARARPEQEGRFKRDPVLDLCVALWERSDAGDRDNLEEVARQYPVFPTRVSADDSVHRIALRDEIAFYPPRSASDDLPLRRLKFLAHDICWGSLKLSEQGRVLEEEMKAWSALFDMKEFRFGEVMRAAVLPGLAKRDPDAELREANRSFEALATICRLAGPTTKPDQPLPMARLGSDKAFFPLSRLEVPCHRPGSAETIWAPAYRVYFGTDWVGQQSIEELSDAMTAAESPIDVLLLAPPADFASYSEGLVQESDADDSSGVDDKKKLGADADEEAEIEADADEALETSVEDRWRNFFEWLGVSRGLRLIHFHDVDDDDGWVRTRDLGMPRGWAFHGLDSVWAKYLHEAGSALTRDQGRWERTDHYLYRVHTLDHLGLIAPAAERAETGVAEALLGHLARNWSSYAKHSAAEFALVDKGKAPSMRMQPPRANGDELLSVFPDFWLYRLRERAICPTSHGPRRPSETWRNSDELRRRLDFRGGRRADDLLPVLQTALGEGETIPRSMLDALEVRGELVPAAFTIDDARSLAARIASLYETQRDDPSFLRQVRPMYREMFMLLAGADAKERATLSDAPMAARTPYGFQFLPAKDVIYAAVSGSRERSGVQDKLNLFVIEAEASALRPLRDLFRMPLLESALDWTIPSFEPSFEGRDLEEFRGGLRTLMAPLLARLGADRADHADDDRRALRAFVEAVIPVRRLAMRVRLAPELGGTDLGVVPERDYFVESTRGRTHRALVVWSESPWPPVPEDAQTLAMALAEALGVNTVETFLSFINATDAQRRRLLGLAGAVQQLEAINTEEDPDDGDSEVTSGGELAPALPLTDGTSTEPASLSSSQPSIRPPEVAKVPLYQFGQLMFGGAITPIVGERRAESTSGGSTFGSHGSDPGQTDDHAPNDSSRPRAASGTDRSELDRLGMRVAIAFEQQRVGGSVAILPGDQPMTGVTSFIVDTSEMAMIDEACRQSPAVDRAFRSLYRSGLSRLFPGFDILTIVDGEIDRLIELKSSGIDARVQEMSWNEWKSAQGTRRQQFWLYLAGNLRSDMPDALPFVRAVHDPFGMLSSSEEVSTLRKRSVQLRVKEFAAADELTIDVVHTE